MSEWLKASVMAAGVLILYGLLHLCLSASAVAIAKRSCFPHDPSWPIAAPAYNDARRTLLAQLGPLEQVDSVEVTSSTSVLFNCTTWIPFLEYRAWQYRTVVVTQATNGWVITPPKPERRLEPGILQTITHSQYIPSIACWSGFVLLCAVSLFFSKGFCCSSHFGLRTAYARLCAWLGLFALAIYLIAWMASLLGVVIVFFTIAPGAAQMAMFSLIYGDHINHAQLLVEAAVLAMTTSSILDFMGMRSSATRPNPDALSCQHMDDTGSESDPLRFQQRAVIGAKLGFILTALPLLWASHYVGHLLIALATTAASHALDQRSFQAYRLWGGACGLALIFLVIAACIVCGFEFRSIAARRRNDPNC